MSLFRGDRARRAVTMIELLVVVGIIAVLIALISAGIQSARGAAARTQCVNNLQQIGLLLLRHVDVNGSVPTAVQIESAVGSLAQQQGSSLFVCPSTVKGRSYGYNTCAKNLSTDGDSGRIVALDAKCATIAFSGSTSSTWNLRVDPRHRSFLNVLFLDGRVETLSPSAINPYDATKGADNVATFWRPRQGCTGDLEDCSGLTDPSEGMSYYYTTFDWSGTPWTRRDTTLHGPFGGGVLDGSIPYSSPIPGSTNAPPASFKMIGKIVADTTDDYTFWMAVDDYGWFLVNGKEVNVWYGGTRGWNYYNPSAPVRLYAGEPVSFELRQTNTGRGPAHISVKWSSTANPNPTVIPAANLTP